MLKIGLTGGIGSGKSTVRDMLQDKGAVVFDADAVAKHLMEEDESVREGLMDVLGPQTWNADGRLNRSWIARQIFADDNVRKAVNAVVHPAVYEAFDLTASRAEASGAPAIVREAALLPPASIREKLDSVVAISASKAVRLQRVLDRGGLTVSEIEGRMGAQPDNEQYVAFADEIILNNGSLSDLQKEVDRIWKGWFAS
ncbi:MAG: dephospho-CoA kinase [Rhodothermales bacterium]